VFIFIRVSELDFEEWASSSWIMKNGSDNTFNVALSFRIVKISVSWWSNSFGFGGSVDTAYFTLSLGSNDFTHIST
jgi:hypothetical protein